MKTRKLILKKDTLENIGVDIRKKTVSVDEVK
jgi:hypothetical protein